jgi:hypothetical protein
MISGLGVKSIAIPDIPFASRATLPQEMVRNPLARLGQQET